VQFSGPRALRSAPRSTSICTPTSSMVSESISQAISTQNQIIPQGGVSGVKLCTWSLPGRFAGAPRRWPQTGAFCPGRPWRPGPPLCPEAVDMECQLLFRDGSRRGASWRPHVAHLHHSRKVAPLNGLEESLLRCVGPPRSCSGRFSECCNS
jgi:hypothetical protein